MLHLLVAAALSADSFLTIGDWGGAALHSYYATTVGLVAQAMARAAADANPAFIINTGDNFYWCGLSNASDPQISTDWLQPYSDPALRLTWYNVLGNHEYGYNVEAQLQMPYQYPTWVMDDRYYTRRLALGGGAAHVSFIFTDTSPCVQAYRSTDPAGWDPCGSQFPSCDPNNRGPCKFNENIVAQDCGAQFAWFKKALAKVPDDDWLIVVGHHPSDELDVEDFTTAMQDRGFDLYLNGHAHTLTHYSVDGKAAYVTSGAGAMIDTADQHDEHIAIKVAGGDIAADDAVGSGHAYRTVWNQKTAGFTRHTFSDDYKSLTTDYLSYEGSVLHTFTVERGARSPPAPPAPTCKQGWPCESGCSYVHKANEKACGVASYGCYSCADLPAACPDCSSGASGGTHASSD